ncbi:MAG: lamin tail domain-containing protein [Balneolaceae bacterium]|nr:lamin tail domain-containing protein [Balneolaceae bacterium]
MPITIRKGLLHIVLGIAMLLVSLPDAGYSQSPGDIAIIGFNGDGDYEIAIVSFVDISAGTKIYFRDESWDNTTATFPEGEGKITYTVPSGGVNKGSVVVINPATETASDGGTVDEVGGYNFSATGDELYAFLGNSTDEPTTFLFAITTKSSWGANEVPSDLTDGSTALSNIGGTSNQDNGEYTGSRKNTVSGLKSLISEVDSQWTTTDGEGDQSISFDETPFTIVDPPTLAFTSESITVSEDAGSVNIAIELVESNNTDVSVDVVYLDAASSTTTGDLSNYSTQTVSFSFGDGSGTTRTVTLGITDDSEFEGMERAVLQLTGNTTGSLVSSVSLTVVISDDDSPDIVINEIHADPDPSNGDANGDNVVDTRDDEFIEFINNESFDIDISGWKFKDSSADRFTFPDGTVIPSGTAFVLFADTAEIEASEIGYAALFDAGALDLNNGGETLTLTDQNGNEVVSVDNYSEADDNQSITRDPDISGSFVKHSEATNAGGSLFSPGTKADGTPFGSKYAVSIRGEEGWRMISSPTENTTFSDLFSGFWMQGIPGSDAENSAATIYYWDEAGETFSIPTGMNSTLVDAKGYIVYFFEDDKFSTPGIQGGFPKIVSSDKPEHSGSVTVTVSATDADNQGGIDGNEGWNLLGNPFGTDISVDAVLTALQAVNADVQLEVQVWDHDANGGNGAYEGLTAGETIAPFQAFWVKFNTAFSGSEVTFSRNNLAANIGTDFYKRRNQTAIELTFTLSDGTRFDNFYISLNNEATTEQDPHDISKLFSLNPNAINLYSTTPNMKLVKNSLPVDMQTTLRVPLQFEAPGRQNLELSWKGLENLPEGWQLYLRDTQLDKEADLLAIDKYKFSLSSGSAMEKQKSGEDNPEITVMSENVDRDPRFELLVIPPEAREGEESEQIPESVKLNPNYPNPFNPSTTISFELAEQSPVELNVYTIVGQKVATLVDEVREAGEHKETWNAADMPSGIYIAQLEVNGRVYIRKMTLIK